MKAADTMKCDACGITLTFNPSILTEKGCFCEDCHLSHAKWSEYTCGCCKRSYYSITTIKEYCLECANQIINLFEKHFPILFREIKIIQADRNKKE